MAMETIQTDEGEIYTWQVPDRHYWLTPKTFTKRQQYPHEQIKLYDREIRINVPWSRARLENEFKALNLISERTSIPVPKPLQYKVENDIASLTTETLKGEMLCDLLKDLDEDDRAKLRENVENFIQNKVLPQLQSLKSNTLGGLSGVVIPPQRVDSSVRNPQYWKPKISEIEKYTFCHNDLAQQNIMVDPETLEPVAIIDWEYSGFYPPGFELLLYRKTIWEVHQDSYANVDKARLITLLNAPGMSRSITTFPDLTDYAADTMMYKLRKLAGIPKIVLRSLFKSFTAKFRSAISILLPWLRRNEDNEEDSEDNQKEIKEETRMNNEDGNEVDNEPQSADPDADSKTRAEKYSNEIRTKHPNYQ